MNYENMHDEGMKGVIQGMTWCGYRLFAFPIGDTDPMELNSKDDDSALIESAILLRCKPEQIMFEYGRKVYA